MTWKAQNQFDHRALSAIDSSTNALFAWRIIHQPAVLFSQNKPATSNQPAVFFSQNKPAPAISHQPNEQATTPDTRGAPLQHE
jgi:hypothetical protein